MVYYMLSLGRYITRALTLFFGEDKKFVTIKAAERLIDRALWVSEVVCRRVKGLHQIIKINERKIVDVYEPKEEGLVKVEQERFLTIVEVTLTKEPTAAEKKEPGYRAPLNLDDSEFLTKEKWEKQEEERKEQGENRKNRSKDERNRENNRGEERRRGNNRRR
jgi:hypothetical protein